MIHVDSSALIEAIVAPARLLVVLEHLVKSGEPLAMSPIVLFEWRRGPRTAAELRLQQELFPPTAIAPLGGREALEAARLYRIVRRPRGREADLLIAATAITCGARLWTLNRADFADIPGLKLYA